MITASKALKEFIRNQNSIESFAEKMDVTRQTIYNILDDSKISSDMIAKFIEITGFDFEKAFEVNE